MSSVRPAPSLLVGLEPGSGSGPSGGAGMGVGGGGGGGGAGAVAPGASPLVCAKCKRSLVIHDSAAVSEQAVVTFASGHLAETEEERARMVARDTFAIEQLGEVFAMAPTQRYNYRAAERDKATGNTIPLADADKKMAAIQTLFEIATERTNYEMPLCFTCGEGILSENAIKLKALETERDAYRNALKKFDGDLKTAQTRNMPAFTAGATAAAGTAGGKPVLMAKASEDVPPPPPPPPEHEELDLSALLAASATAPPINAELERQLAAEELVSAKAEREILDQIESIQRERLALKTELKTLELENRSLDAFESRFWSDFQEFQMEMDRFSEEQNSVKQKIRSSMEQLARMKRTNVYDDTFHISYDGHFGTINGFRLGKLQSLNVEWSEINAALGQVVLLLHTLARQCNFKFTKYKLIPLGSFSKIGKKDEKDSAANELFGSGEALLTRLFWFRRFDAALEWLLFCVKEISDHAALTDKTFKQRYPIKDEYIGGVSIKLQFNQDAKWTKALKYLLTNLKYLLVWTSKRYD